MRFSTRAEEHFEKLRLLLIGYGYDRSRIVLQVLSRLRAAMRAKGYSFRDDEVHHV